MTAIFRGFGAEARAGDRPSVAVLPFNNLGGDPGERYFSDGVPEDIIVELSRFRDLLVIAPSSSFACEPFASDVGRVARELDVRYVLGGGIRRAGNRLRITAQLVDSRGGDRIWADRHDESMGDMLEVQAEIAARIVGSLVPELHHAEQQRAGRATLDDPRAYDVALKAAARINEGLVASDGDAITEGIALAEEAAAIDPSCRRAHHAVAWGYCRRGVLGFLADHARADFDRADAAALRLRELDEGNHGAYAILGHIAMRKRQHDQALASLGRANHLNPNDVTTLRWLSWVTSNGGDAEAARAHAELSLRLSPRDRAIDASHWCLALAAYVAGDLQTCLENAKRAIALNRRFSGHYVLLAACLAEAGQVEEAQGVVATLMQLAPGLIQARLAGRTYFDDPALAGRYKRALALAARGVVPAGPASMRADSPLSAPPLAESGVMVAARPDTIREGRNGRDAGRESGRDALAGTLTQREREVLRAVAKGQNNGEIAAELGLSEHTVKRHVANILMKLDLPTRAAAVAAAAREGLL